MNNGHFNDCCGKPCLCEERRYWIIFAVSCAIAGIEVFTSVLSGSVSLLADSFHVSLDGGAAITSVVTARLVRRYPLRETRVRQLGGYFAALLILGSAVWIALEAGARLRDPPPIVSGVMMAGAIFGGIGNYYQHRFLHRAHATHRTHRLLTFHVLTDLWQSVAVIVGGATMGLTGWYLVDPVLSLALAAVMAIGLLFISSHQQH